MKYTVDDMGSAVREHSEEKTRSAKSGPQQEEMMKRMEAAGTPGPGHKALEPLVGQWKAEVKCWSDPGAAPHISQGTSKANWILNGRFLDEEFHGEMMGKPFTGRTLIGYDNVKGTFNSVWISDMQTSLFKSEGKGENDNKVITFEGKSSCAATGRQDVSVKSILRIHGPDKHTFEMFDGRDGGNVKTLEITYTRK